MVGEGAELVERSCALFESTVYGGCIKPRVGPDP